jgi:hypothetical protein
MTRKQRGKTPHPKPKRSAGDIAGRGAATDSNESKNEEGREMDDRTRIERQLERYREEMAVDAPPSDAPEDHR